MLQAWLCHDGSLFFKCRHWHALGLQLGQHWDHLPLLCQHARRDYGAALVALASLPRSDSTHAEARGGSGIFSL